MKKFCLSYRLGTVALFLLAVGLLEAQSITVTVPATGVTWYNGTGYTITWLKSGTMDSSVKIRLYDSTGVTNICDITDATDNDGSYPWTPTGIAAGQYVIRVKTVDNAVSDDSGVFSIANNTPAGITVTEPTGSSIWVKGSSYTIRWTKTGRMDSRVKITLYDSTGINKVYDISDGTNNDQEHVWAIPAGDTIPAGRYLVRVKTLDNAVFDDSPVFSIGDPIIFQMTPLVAPVDLGIRNVSYTFGHGGQIVARVSCGTNRIDTDVKFHIHYTDGSGRGNEDITRRVTLDRGSEGNIYLKALNQNNIPLSGMGLEVTADPDNRLSDPNRANNSFSTRLAILDMRCTVPRDDLKLFKLIMQGGDDYRVEFKIHVQHNLAQPVNNIGIHYELQDRGGAMRGGNAIGSFTIASLAPGDEWVKKVEILCGKEGRSNAHYPRLSEGGQYWIAVNIINPASELFDVSTANNASRISFRVGD